MRVPGTGKRVYRHQPESEWVVSSAPHLRIISDELFAAVKKRFEITQKLWGTVTTNGGLTRGHAKHVYLFSGLLVCECGGSITLVGGCANTSRSEFGCSLHAQRGKAVCANNLRIQRTRLEVDLLNGLQRRVLREEFIDYVVRGLQEELRKRHESLNAQLELARNEKRQIEGELRRLVESIAALHSSPTIVAAITEREAKLRPITHKLIEFIARAD